MAEGGLVEPPREAGRPGSGHRSSPVWLVGSLPVRPLSDAKGALAACLALAALIFALDVLVTAEWSGETSGLAIPVLYLGMLVPCLWLRWEAAPWMAAAVASGLTGLALAATPGPVRLTDAVGRVLMLLVIWVGALVVHRFRILQAALAVACAEAERAKRSKSRFLSAAGHDLRHPIQAALLFHDVLNRRLRGTPHAEVAANLGLSLAAMQGMLDGMLDISRFDLDQITVRPTDLSVQTLFKSLATRFGPVATASGLGLRVVGCGAMIHSDPELLLRLCDSLLSNAIKYTTNGRVLLGCRRRGDRLGIQVWDTGIGIPGEHLRDIFEEFHQLRCRGELGLGLGLSLVERLGRALDHPIGVRSAVGRGSMFEVLVPLAAGQCCGGRSDGCSNSQRPVWPIFSGWAGVEVGDGGQKVVPGGEDDIGGDGAQVLKESV